MAVKAYILDVAGLLGEREEEKERFRYLCSILSEDRQQKIERFRYAQGKALSLGAGLLLDYGLRQYGIREREARLVYGENEKPYLRDYPGIFFNLSHSGSMAMAVFADKEVGCDVEQIGNPDFRVARRFFAEGERKLLEKAEDKEARELFYRFWVLKESFLKVTGEGIRMPLNDFCICFEEKIRVEVKGQYQKYGFCELALPGYRAALCLKGEEDVEVKMGRLFLENLFD
ncbi:4'-phosphopantetheinyl transferase family protein [Parablautia intestinalis]|uniref:4'-phosphopantetheinyl transferase family protein n=1 Tax=Parablautia intestinalis TaxID=2320100 RepID=UPI00256EC033|nr:4'-phosphopantetheinyl transferase superfamily protein [Parablautia intestinalis]